MISIRSWLSEQIHVVIERLGILPLVDVNLVALIIKKLT